MALNFEHRWLSCQHDVKLFNEEGDLRLEVTDRTNKSSTSSRVNLGGRPVKEGISYLRHHDMIVEGLICRPQGFEYDPRWPARYQVEGNSSLDISLVSKQGELIWRLYNMETKTASWVEAQREELAEFLDKAPTEEEPLRTYIRDYEMTIEVNDDCLVRVQLALKSLWSELASVKINRDLCAVTLVSGGRSCGPKLLARIGNDSLEKGHAMLVIERVKEGKRHVTYAHLTTVPRNPLHQLGRDEAEPEIFYRDEVMDVRAQSPTWQRSTALALRVLNWIKKEREAGPLVFKLSGNSLLRREMIMPFIEALLRGIFIVTPVMIWDNHFNKKDPRERYRLVPTPDRADKFLMPTLFPLPEDEIYNCLLWAIKIVCRFKIFLPEPKGVVKDPESYLGSLKLEAIKVREEDG